MEDNPMFQRPTTRLRGWTIGVLTLLFGLIACHKVERNNPFDPALTPAVDIISIINDTTAGSVTLTWTQYEGDQLLSLPEGNALRSGDGGIRGIPTAWDRAGLG